ncbi:MAG: DUF952 domain-containing protein [Pseudomonadota bacterium]
MNQRSPSSVLYKILRAEEWAAFQRVETFAGAPVDLADGYVHFSTADQVRETAAKHFSGVEGLVLVAVDAGALRDDLRWEPSRGGALFPHLYAALPRSAVLTADPLPLGPDGAHAFPDGFGDGSE